MDHYALVEPLIDAGQRLIQELKDDGMDVIVACWIKCDDEEQSYLYIASSEVDDSGSQLAYRRLHGIVRSKPEIGIDPFEVRLISPDDPLVAAIKDLYLRYPARIPTRLRHREFAGRSIDGAYIYPPSP